MSKRSREAGRASHAIRQIKWIRNKYKLTDLEVRRILDNWAVERVLAKHHQELRGHFRMLDELGSGVEKKT